MPLEYSEFLIFLFVIVLVASMIFAFTMGTLFHIGRSRKKIAPKEKVKAKQKPTPKPKPLDPRCLNAKRGFYVGMLKNSPKDRDYLTVCDKYFECPCAGECIGMVKK